MATELTGPKKIHQLEIITASNLDLSEDYIAISSADRPRAVKISMNEIINYIFGHMIATITNQGGFALVTTHKSHQLPVGGTVNIRGNTIAGYNISNSPYSTISLTTFLLGDVPFTSNGFAGVFELQPIV